ncbi:MAG: acylphosphatase [Leptospirales bacterium]|nr:acylphosphatase [Leptospirales bacterium]
MNAYRYLVRGRVQGVGYRQYCMNLASRLALSGFVRNLADGSVELVCADNGRLEQVEAALKKGPPLARVSEVERVDWKGETPSPFELRG